MSLQRNLKAYAVKLTRNVDTADDLVATTFLKAVQASHRFESGTNLSAWLFTILRNTWFSEMRKKKREVEDPEGIFAASLSTPANQDAHVELQEVWGHLEELPHSQSAALIAIALRGDSYQDTAKVLGIAEGTVKSRVNRARVALLEGETPVQRPVRRLRKVPARSAALLPISTIPTQITDERTTMKQDAVGAIDIRFFPEQRVEGNRKEAIQRAQSVVYGRVSSNREGVEELAYRVRDALQSHIEKADIRDNAARSVLLDHLAEVENLLGNGRLTAAINEMIDGMLEQCEVNESIHNKPFRIKAIQTLFNTNGKPTARINFWTAMADMCQKYVPVMATISPESTHALHEEGSDGIEQQANVSNNRPTYRTICC